MSRNFNWQEGFGAFSYSKSQIDHVIKYILNQEEHHKKQTFKEEYLEKRARKSYAPARQTVCRNIQHLYSLAP